MPARFAREPRLGPRRRSSGQAGGSILEVVIAAALVTIIALNAVAFFARGRASFDQEEKKRAATLLAQDALERAVSMSFDEIASRSEARTIGIVPYSIAVTVQTNTPEAEMKTVRAEVTWPATPSVDRTVSVTTMVYNN